MDNVYKRQFREMPQETKDKISAKMRGRKLSQETKNRISQGQKKAWAKIPHQQTDNIQMNNNRNNL